MSNTVTWGQHQFELFHPNVQWNEVAGVYIFAGLGGEGRWYPLYIGQASSFANRLPNHERWAEAARRGATHIHAMVVPQQAQRNSIEAYLIQVFQPPLNTQLR